MTNLNSILKSRDITCQQRSTLAQTHRGRPQTISISEFGGVGGFEMALGSLFANVQCCVPVFLKDVVCLGFVASWS